MSGSQAIQHPRASCTPPMIQSIPIEILSHIIFFIDKSTALSLARVSRHFTPHCDPELWRELNLSLSAAYGRLPLIRPTDKEGGTVHEARKSAEWEAMEYDTAERWHRRALRERMRTILLRIDERRAGMVKRVRVIPRIGSVDAQLQIIDLVRDAVERLHILPPAFDIPEGREPLSLITLDIKLLHADISLPNLTCVTIGQSVMHYLGFLNLICRSAPNLASLDVDRCLAEVKDDDDHSFPALERDTKLKELRIATTDYAGLRTYEVQHILHLLQRSPQVQNLSLDFDEYSDGAHATFRQIVNGYTDLRNLHLIENLPSLDDAHAGAVIGGSARSLALLDCTWWKTFLYLPNTPNVEALFLFPYQTSLTPPKPLSLSRDPAAAHAMIPSFAQRLRDCKALRIMHTASEPIGGDLSLFSRLDEIERHDTLSGVARSIRHSGHELLHVRLLQRYKQIYDEAVAAGIDDTTETDTQLTYTAHDGSEHLKRFEELPELTWVDYTDYEGDVVPLWVLGEMRRVQGANEAEWVGRGIEVGEAAWKVLTDWRDGMLAGSQGANEK